MRLTKHFCDAICSLKLCIEFGGIPFVGKFKLIAQIDKTVVDGCRRKHENFSLHAFLDDILHKHRVAVELHVAFVVLFLMSAIAEVVRFVYDNEIVILPVDEREVYTV